ncbi:MAG: GH1 family beta-glucosidase [Pseudomonadota bacterium]
MNFKRSDFPDGFVFGAATSAYQIEGHSFGGAGETEWDTFAATPGNVSGGENGAVACDHYHRFEEDLDLAAAAGFDAYRFSTSWARIQPDGAGPVNEAGLDFYDRLIDAALARDLKPFATLYHWELPSALADLGGWRNREVAERFGDFSEIVARRLGDRLHATAPINEPWCVAWLSHFVGQHAPGLRDLRAAGRAMHHVLVGHARSVEALRAAGVNNVGIVVNFEWAEPADQSAEAAEAAALYDEIYNRWFIGAVRNGEYPERALAGLAPYLPDGWRDDMQAISAPVDWIGVNYYTRKLIASDGSGRFPGYLEVEGDLPKTSVGWEIYPAGLGAFLRRVEDEYAKGLPIFVTENGLALDDPLIGGGVNDQTRIAYIEAHLAEVLQARREGVQVEGYFMWSLLDNYEWSLGYKPRFGLVHVDFDSQVRTPKASHAAISSALRR